MGSCISKCNPKKTFKKNQTQNEECKCQYIEKNDTNTNTITPAVQDKLVISQAPIPPPSPPKSSSSSATSNYPDTSTSSCSWSTKSCSSMSMSTSTSSCSLPSSASSLASCSSIPSLKLEQSFSNDYLWSCDKDNPQFLNEDYHPPIKVANPRRNSLPTKCQTNVKKPNRPKEFPGPSPQRVTHSYRSAPQKRARCNSPSNLTRQKSFRREAEVEPNRPVSRTGRDSRPMSPSSSRRFNGEACNHQGRNLTSSMRRDNCHVRPQSPNKSYNSNNNSRKYGRSNNFLVKRENEKVIKEVSSKIEELGMGDLVSNNQDVDMMPIEDVNNPHIALDCFIFL